MPSNALYSHPFFKDVDLSSMTTDERVSLSYKRARLILQTYSGFSLLLFKALFAEKRVLLDLTLSDVLDYSPKFWDMHLDPIIPLDIATFTILAAHVNLTIGTLARYVKDRPDLEPLLASMLRLDTVGIYLLSERGHGLDSFNDETTATRMANGEYILNTPREEATKYIKSRSFLHHDLSSRYRFMPASTPSFGVRKVALVFARLIVNQEDRGHRWFIVPICDEVQLYPGIVSKRLPTRSGTSPLDFSLTSFHNVRLPAGALLGSSLEAPVSPHDAWWTEVWRIPLGSMAVAAPFVQAIKHTAYIGGSYSLHRSVVGRGPVPTAIINFPTQQWPILSAVATGNVLEAWYRTLTAIVVDQAVDPRVRHGLSVVAKTTIMRHFQRCADVISERCGAQGTFESNFIARALVSIISLHPCSLSLPCLKCDCKGVIIAEGDVLALCIRLFSELLLKRYSLPLPAAESSVLARHAHDILNDATALSQSMPGGHRSQTFQSLILPQSEDSIAAFGHAMAYAAAKAAGVSKRMLDIYELNVIELDAVWYSEKSGIGKLELLKRRSEAMAVSFPHLREDLDKLGVEKHVQAPIVEDRLLKASFKRLPTYRGPSSQEEESRAEHLLTARL
ncbi:unnamed protein product [Peniophora sp. CBMAI 1063]|nr:unnamed protein product [Peniophora sp. CBMAI 1063]